MRQHVYISWGVVCYSIGPTSASGNVFYSIRGQWGVLTLTLTYGGIKELPLAAGGVRHTIGTGGAGGVIIIIIIIIQGRYL